VFFYLTTIGNNYLLLLKKSNYMKKFTLLALLVVLISGSIQAQEKLVSKTWYLDSLNMDGVNIPIPTEVVPGGDPAYAYPAGDIVLIFEDLEDGNYRLKSMGMSSSGQFSVSVDTSFFTSVMTDPVSVLSTSTEDWIVDDFTWQYFNSFLMSGLFFPGGGDYSYSANTVRISKGSNYAVYHYICSIGAPSATSSQSLDEGQTLADLEVTASEGAELLWFADIDMTEPLPATTVAEDGTTYYVAQTDGDCTSTVRAITVHLILGLNTIEAHKLKIYPNPVKEELTISIDPIYNVSSSSVLIVDILGKVVRSFEMNAPTQTFNLGQLPSGIYMLKYSGGQHSFTHKLVIE
jgi:hypothetical protein